MAVIPSRMKYPENRDSWLKSPETFMHSFTDKQEWNNRGMYAFVSWKWVIPFVKWINGRKCLEVMAGAGWLSLALRQKGVDVIATDNMSWHKLKRWKNVTPVEPLSAKKAIEKYGAEIDIMIIGWPYMDDHAYYALKLLHKLNPNANVVYIGEGDGGCTASPKFFKHFREEEDQEFDQVAKEYERFYGMHDYMFLGRYKPKKL